MAGVVVRLLAGCGLLACGLFSSVLASSLEHRIQVDLQPQSGEIRVQDQLQVSGIGEYRFRLAAWLQKIEVKVNGSRVEVKRRGRDLVVELPDDASHQLAFDISGVIPARDESNVGNMTSSSNAEGVYLPGYDHWIPHPAGESMRYQLMVKVPLEQRVVVTGKLVDEQLSSSHYQASFTSTQNAEAPSLFAGPYQVQERLWQGLRLRTYFHAEIAGEAETYLDAAAAYINRYQDSIGDYPYADFHMVSAPLPVGLGFPGLTYIDRRIVPLPFMRSRSLAHEVVHNWWGNAVAVEYAGGNWAEGLTTYLADYALAADEGEAEARAMRIKWLRDYAALPAERDHPVNTFRSKQHDAAQVIGYNKTAFIFHMLRHEIGEQAFSDGLRGFWREHRFDAASWQDLQIAFEKTASRKLDWFFRQWLEQTGAPVLSLGSHRVEQTADGFRTFIEILQPLAGYRFSLDVLLMTKSGPEQRRLVIEDQLTQLEWVTPSRPQWIHFDPQSDLFRRLQTTETPPIMRDITLNPSTVVLIDSDQPEFVKNAKTLAARLLDTAPRFLEPGQSRGPAQTLLLITTTDRLDGQLEGLQLQLPEDLPDIEHGAAVWTARLANSTPVLVISATSNEELQAILRPLPHYGGQSFVLFDGGKARSRGLWPITRGSLYRDLAVDP